MLRRRVASRPVRRRQPAVAIAVLGTAVAALAGCGSSSAPPVATPLPTAPEPAVSPPAPPDLPGQITDLSGAPEGIAVTASGVVAVNVRQPAGLVIAPITALGAAPARRTVPLAGEARHLTLGGPDGPALVAEEPTDRFVTVALPGGQVGATTTVGHQPHEAFQVGTTTWVANELGNNASLVRNGQVVRVVPAPLQPGGGAASPDGSHAVIVGVRGRRITEYTAAGDIVGSANCGAGPTHTATGSGGLFWVMDTNGGAVLGFTLTATGPKQVATIPVGAGSKPYGVAYDAARRTLWVTLTGYDQVLGLTFDGTRVTQRRRFATVQQPNSVAVDPATGQVVVTGSTPAGHLQLLQP
jgi:DNA-binding beta-propeller fold protein YncE